MNVSSCRQGTSSVLSVVSIIVIIKVTLVLALNCADEDGFYTCANLKGCYNIKEKCNGHYDCEDLSDENNCTHYIQTHQVVLEAGDRTTENLAWLITPIVFLLAVIFSVYKCLKEGICLMRRRRRNNSGERSRSGFYCPLGQISLHRSSQIPCSYRGPSRNSSRQQLMLVHSESVCLSFRETDGLENLAQPIPPPSYEEAMATVPSSQPDSELPAYSDIADDNRPAEFTVGELENDSTDDDNPDHSDSNTIAPGITRNTL